MPLTFILSISHSLGLFCFSTIVLLATVSSSTDFPYREFLESSYGEPLINWDKPTPIWKLLKQCGKTADRAEKFLKKINSAQVSSGNRVKLVPANVTIRRKYIKCGKPLCRRTHGPYYYAY